MMGEIDETTAVPVSEYEQDRGKPVPSLNHAIVQGNLLVELHKKYKDRYAILPEIKLALPTRDRVPDLAIYPPLAYDGDRDEIKMTQAPLGVIEILSPLQNVSELIQKRGDYFLAGVKSYWLVAPGLDTIHVFYAPDDYEVFYKKETLRDKMLDIAVSLADIFK